MNRRALLIGAATNWLAFAATLGVAFFIAPYLIRKFGEAQYGVWVFVESIAAYLTLFDLGIAACVVRFVARFRAGGQKEELNRLVSAAWLLFLLLGAAVFVVGLAISGPIGNSLAGKVGLDAGELVVFAMLMFGNLAFGLPLSIAPAILDGLQQFTAKSVVRIVFLLVRTLGTIALVESQPSLVDLAVLFTACNVVEHLLLFGLCFRGLPGLRFSLSLADRPTLRLVRGYSLNAFAAMISGRICVQSPVVLIGICLTVPQVTWYAVASRLVEFAKALLRTATNTLTPAFSAWDAGDNHKAIRDLFLAATRWTLYLILPVQFGLMLLGEPFLFIWLKSSVLVAESYPVLLILSSTLALVIAQSSASRVLYGTGELGGFARLTGLEAILNLAVAAILIGPFGILGVAIGVAIANSIFCMLVIGSVCKRLDVPLSRYLARAWLKPLAAAVVLIPLWALGNRPVNGWVDFGRELLLGLVPFGLCVFLLEAKKLHVGMPFRPRFRSPKQVAVLQQSAER